MKKKNLKRSLSIIVSMAMMFLSSVDIYAAQDMQENLVDNVLEENVDFIEENTDHIETEADNNGRASNEINLRNPYRHDEKTITYLQPTSTTTNRKVEIKAPVWDCIWFGNYWQEDTNGDGYSVSKNTVITEIDDLRYDQDGNIHYNLGVGSYLADNKQPIKWRVLSVNGNDALLLADKLLATQPYKDNMVNFYLTTTWADSDVRRWLNDSFYNDAFDLEEQEAIKFTNVINDPNPIWGTDGGIDTTDKIYLLALADCYNPDYGFDPANYSTKTNYHSSAKDPARLAYETKFAQYLNEDIKDPQIWMLRSPGQDASSYAQVSHLGNVYEPGTNTYISKDGVRPVLHIDLSSDCWKYAGTVCADGSVEEIAPSTSNVDPESDVDPDFDIKKEDIVPLTQGAVLASKNDNFALEATAGKINKMVANFENVGKNSVSADDLKVTVVKGTKFSTIEKIKSAESDNPKSIKVKINKKTGFATVTPKTSGKLTIVTEAGKTYKLTITVESPKAQKAVKNQSINKEIKLTVKDMFNTTIDGGKLSALSKSGQKVTVSDNSIIFTAKEKDKIKVTYEYVNKKYKTTISAK